MFILEVSEVDVHDTLPEAVTVPPNALKSAVEIVKLSQVAAVNVTVNKVPGVGVEFASKNTLSAFVGADAPDAPPEEVDQLVVDTESQVPVPPTQ
jgi:hypothetical protein